MPGQEKDYKDRPILHLNLYKKYFDMIGDTKLKEYRKINAYWSRKFGNGNIKIRGKYYHASDAVVCFSNGYSKTRPQKIFEINRLCVEFGNSDLGSNPHIQYYTIYIGTRLK